MPAYFPVDPSEQRINLSNGLPVCRIFVFGLPVHRHMAGPGCNFLNSGCFFCHRESVAYCSDIRK